MTMIPQQKQVGSNSAWQLARRPPQGWPTPEDFAWTDTPAPTPGPDQILTRTLYLSLDPYQWMRRRSGTEAVGEVCHGRTVSQVIDSRLPGYQAGDIVFNTNGWQRYGLTGAGISNFGYMLPRTVDPAVAPISTALGVLGMLGLTAYAGLVVQCQPLAGETVVVSAASGGVGQCVGQIARILGCRVVGIAGTTEKCDYAVQTLGFDACVCHRSDDLPAALAAACPDGIDIYFENVGGDVFAAVLPLLNQAARITLCGLISQYGNTDGGDMFKHWQAAGAATFAKQNVAVHSLFVGNFVESHQAVFLEQMGQWLSDGQIHYREHFSAGLESAPAAFADMLKGANFGKTIVTVSPDPTAR